MIRRPLLTAGLGLCLIACGPAPTPSSGPVCTPPPVPPTPHAAAGPLVGIADRARVDPGGHVNFVETVTGPAAFAIDCEKPLQLIVSDSAQLHVYSGQSSPGQPGSCGDLKLAGGATRNYAITWPVEETLPGGAYTATLVLGNAPQLTLSVAVGTAGHC